MALLLDDRVGSKDLAPRLRTLGVSTSLVRLPFADAAFVGRGRGDQPWQVGVELKTVSDMTSCILSGRFAAHQLPGLLDAYDDVWLVVEGRWRARRDGVLEIDMQGHGRWFPLTHGRQRWMYRDVVNYLHSMCMLGGVRLWRTENRDETARWLAALHGWWTAKPLDKHTALQVFTEAAEVRAQDRGAQSAQLRAPSFERRVFKELPGTGWARAQEIERAFPTVFDAVMADARAWARIPGIGKVLAEKITGAWHGRK